MRPPRKLHRAKRHRPIPPTIVPRLQGAVARVLPAIEATVANLAAGPMPPREMERAARTLTSLTRTLRELNELLSQHQPQGGRICECDMPEDIDAFRYELARRIERVHDFTDRPTVGANPARRLRAVWRVRRRRRLNHVPLVVAVPRLAVSIFTPGPIVEEIATRLM